MTDAERDAEKTRKRIGDLHTMLGSDAEAESALQKLLALLVEEGKTWELLTLTIQDGLEQLALLSPEDVDQLADNDPVRALHAFMQLSPDDKAALVGAHDQVGDPATSAEPRERIKTILEPLGLNWTDLSNLLRHSMEQIEDWQPNLLDEIIDLVGDFVVFKRRPHDGIATSLWYMHTFVYRQFQYTPRYMAISEDPYSGKSVAVSHIGGELTLNPAKYVADKNVAASLYWTMHHEQPTTLLDEAQNAEVVDTLKSIINGGFDQALGGIPRRQGQGGEQLSDIECSRPLRSAGTRVVRKHHCRSIA